MKRILLLVATLLVAFVAANAHCYPSYMWSGSATSVSGSISTSYTGNKKFQTSGSGTTVFTTAVNFTGWNRLNFETKTQVKAPINFPLHGGEIGFYGDNKADYITMNDSDIIYAEGNLSITTLISNNSKPGQWNIIFTDSYVTIAGKKYYPRDTFYSTPGNPETAVLITDCRGVSLPIKIHKYSGRVIDKGVEVLWEVSENEPVTLYYSKDGANWIDIHNIHSPFLITDKAEQIFVRISVQEVYSQTLVFKTTNEEEKYEIYDLKGNRLTIEPVEQVFIKYYPKTNTKRKFLTFY